MTRSACTAVVTEIAYHDKASIDADVSFLTLQEWKQELEVLLNDLVDEDRKARRAIDLRGAAGIAWHKVNTELSQEIEQFLRMIYTGPRCLS